MATIPLLLLSLSNVPSLWLCDELMRLMRLNIAPRAARLVHANVALTGPPLSVFSPVVPRRFAGHVRMRRLDAVTVPGSQKEALVKR